MDNTPRTFALLLNSPLQYSTVRYSSHAERIELDQERTVFYLYYIYIYVHTYIDNICTIYIYIIYIQTQRSQLRCS